VPQVNRVELQLAGVRPLYIQNNAQREILMHQLAPNEQYMSDCTLCPRECHANRLANEVGFCRRPAQLTAARAALHFWEEPCISGTSGSGTVFFSGCNLQCVFCQNHQIAIGEIGRTLSAEQLADIFLDLQKKGAANINLVTGSHYIPQIAHSLQLAKEKGLTLPIVYNTGSYEKVSSLKLLDGLVDIYLPDLKYHSSELSLRYSHAADYFDVATAAIAEMFRQVQTPVFDPLTGMMKRGMIVRHLLLPGQTADTKRVLRYLHNTYKNDIYVSIMNQYTPLSHVAGHPELNRTVSAEEYEKILVFAEKIGIENGFFQEGETAAESFIPAFDYEGLPSPQKPAPIA
jgi:putative pyruvate formate lyase activating enzyme